MDVSLLQRVESLSPQLFLQRAQFDVAVDEKTASAPERPSRTRAYSNELECLLRNLAKGAGLGYGGRVLFSLLGVLRGKRHSARTLFASFEHARWAAFLGSFLAVHNSVMHARTQKPLPHPMEHFRGGIAGTLAGVSLTFAPAYARPYLALLLAVRAAEIGIRSASQKGMVPTALSSHADVKLMCAASAVVMSCWIFEPRALERGYLRFLNRQSGKDDRVLRSIAAAFDGELHSRPGVLAALNAHRASLALPALRMPLPHGCAHCNVLHPAQSCEGHLVGYWAAGWARALPLYAPVHLLPLLLFRPALLLRKPGPLLLQAALKAGRSALFLSSYCASGFAVLCASARLAHAAGLRSRRWHAQLASALCGLALLIEKPGRRLELALFTTTHALRCLPHPGSNDALRRHGSVPLFAVAAGVISHHFVMAPQALRPSYAALLTRFLDTAGGTHRRLLS